MAALIQTVNPAVSTGTITSTVARTGLGALICVFIGQSGVTDTLNAPTDNAGNTYTQAYLASNPSGGRAACYYARNTQPATSVICAFTGSTDTKSVIVREYSGVVVAASTLDRTATATGNSTAPSVSASSTREANELVVASCTHIATSANLTVGSFYADFLQQGMTITAIHGTEDLATAAITTPGATMTASPSGQWAMGIACFILTTGGDVVTSHTRPHSFQPGAAR